MGLSFSTPIEYGDDSTAHFGRFDDTDSLKAFLLAEREFWSFHQKKLAEDGNWSDAPVGRPMRALDGVLEALEMLLDGQGDEARLREAVRRTYTREASRIPTSKDPDAQYLLKLSQELSPKSYVAAAHQILGQGAPFSLRSADQDTLLGLVAAMNFRLGVGSPDSMAAAEAVDSFLDAQKSKLQEMENRLQDHLDQFALATEKTQSHWIRLLEENKDEFAQFRNQEVERSDKAHSDLDALRETYDQKLSIEAPTNYWDSKQKEHKQKSRWWGVVAIGYAFVVSLVLYFSLSNVYSQALELSARPASEFPNGLVPAIVALFAKGLFVTLILLWAGRIIVRRYLSELHLAMNAHERRTMVLTYLALARKGELTNEERLLVLQPLFKSTSDGIVKDDASADPLIATLMAFRGGAGSG